MVAMETAYEDGVFGVIVLLTEPGFLNSGQFSLIQAWIQKASKRYDESSKRQFRES